MSLPGLCHLHAPMRKGSFKAGGLCCACEICTESCQPHVTTLGSPVHSYVSGQAQVWGSQTLGHLLLGGGMAGWQLPRSAGRSPSEVICSQPPSRQSVGCSCQLAPSLAESRTGGRRIGSLVSSADSSFLLFGSSLFKCYTLYFIIIIIIA